MNRCGFYRGGNGSPTARAVHLKKVQPNGRTPPRTEPGITVTNTRVAGWAGGVMRTAPDAEIVRADVEVDGPQKRWERFTVTQPVVDRYRALGRGGDWTEIATAARLGYSALEQVLPAGPLRAKYEAALPAIRLQLEMMRP
jgi:hypothetical protein